MDPGQLVDHGPQRIVIVTNDVLTPRMAGPAIRAWNIALLLAAEHDVRVVSTVGPCELRSEHFTVEIARGEELRKLEQWCDILIFQGSVMYEHEWLKESDKILIVDIYNPLQLETLEQAKDRGEDVRRKDVSLNTQLINEQLARGDFFLAASPKQRNFWLGNLAAIGRINPVVYDWDPSLERLITVVPFGLPDSPPMHRHPALKGVVPGIGPDDRVILWGGGIYNWFDPLTLLRAVDQLRHRLPDVRLYFLGMRHPNPAVPAMRTASEAFDLSAQLGLTGTHVFFNEDWVPYDDRENYLLEADIGVSTHLDHLETAFSFRTRILDYLWAGIPIITTKGDYFADLVDAEKLGSTVPAGDVDALAQALFMLLEDRELAEGCRLRVAEVARQFTWPEVLGNLVEFCRHPTRAPDLLEPSVAATVGLGFPPPPRPPVGVIDNLRILLDHLDDGGIRKVASKLASRLRYVLHLRPGSMGDGAPR
ncbi:MAG: glycosyltransferase family 4 protein [Actinomycetota bacterium]|nr:glycosyltransferase family 4 protein [Actinomycetota bacterium]